MRFPHQGRQGRAVTAEIMRMFADGCASALRGDPAPKFESAMQSLAWHQRSYFCEGHAMGLAARSAMKRRPVNPDSFYAGESYAVARLIGYGFWNGIASRYPVPALRSDSGYWKNLRRWEELRPLLANGESYASMLVRGRFDRSDLAAIGGSPEDRMAALHGAGRVLWLLYMYNYRALREHLEACGADRDAVAVGLGFAAGFINARDAREIPKVLDEFGAARPAAARGAGIGLALHTCNDAESCREVRRQLSGELLEIAEGALQAAKSAGAGAGWYGRVCAPPQM